MKRLITVLCLLPVLACAKEATPMAQNPEVEARVMALATELRCLVCQNQTLADSHSELAGDLRREMREMAEKGMSDKEIAEFMVNRYGDFVLYRPPLKPTTWLLWVWAVPLARRCRHIVATLSQDTPSTTGNGRPAHRRRTQKSRSNATK
jgi:cytochrome c-type biogenesis protein CcmH